MSQLSEFKLMELELGSFVASLYTSSSLYYHEVSCFCGVINVCILIQCFSQCYFFVHYTS
jgi:hypothetical protein